MVHDPEAGFHLCAVVVDGRKVVSTVSLMDEQLTVNGVTLPAGQVELVATATEYEGRGLVRALMDWAHDLSAARGHLLQVMIGIPYFYRPFGYEYSVDIPRARALTRPAAEAAVTGELRSAILADVPALQALQDQAQSSFDVSVPHSAARRRWLLAHPSSDTYLLRRAGHPAGTARVRVDESGVLLAEAAAVDQQAAHSLLEQICCLHPGVPVSVVDRVGTIPSQAWAADLAAPDPRPSQYYARIADPAAVLDAMRPLLFQRLAGRQAPTGELVISTFGKHYRMAIGSDGLGPVRVGGPLQNPHSAGAAGVAPDQLPVLLFGPLGMTGSAARRPDVYPGPDEELFAALFPPLTADLLTFYLPYWTRAALPSGDQLPSERPPPLLAPAGKVAPRVTTVSWPSITHTTASPCRSVRSTTVRSAANWASALGLGWP